MTADARHNSSGIPARDLRLGKCPGAGRGVAGRCCSRKICPIGARLRAPRVSQQDRARARERRGCAPAQRTDTGILRLLRLAFGGAWPLAADKACTPLSGFRIRDGRAHCPRCELYRSEHRGRSRLSAWRRTHLFRAALWARLAVAAGGGVEELAGTGRATLGGLAAPAGSRSGRSSPVLVAKTPLPDPGRRTFADCLRLRADSRLVRDGRRCGHEVADR